MLDQATIVYLESAGASGLFIDNRLFLQASSQQAEAVIDLTSHSLEDAGDSLPAIKQKQKEPMPAIPAIVEPAAAAALSEDAPQPQCPICLDPMKAMACGPCG